MRLLLYAALALTSTTHTKAMECPKLFPSKDLTLPEFSSGGKGGARLQRGHLTYAYMDFGELYAEQTMVPPGGRKVKGGWDIEYNFRSTDNNWLICRYGGNEWGGGNVERWEKLDPNITHCVLKVREIKERSYPTRWTAAATCK